MDKKTLKKKQKLEVKCFTNHKPHTGHRKGPKMPFLSLVTLTFDFDLQTCLRCEIGANPFSVSRDILYTNKKPQTDGAKNRTFRSSLPFTACGKNIELFRPRRRAKSPITIIGMAIEDARYTPASGALRLRDNPRPDGKTRNSEISWADFPKFKRLTRRGIAHKPENFVKNGGSDIRPTTCGAKKT